MIALLNWRLWAAAGLAALLAVTHFTAYKSGKANVRADWDAEKVVQLENLQKANDENRRIENKRQSSVIAAQAEADRRMGVLRGAADLAASESLRLRDAIRAAGLQLPSRSPAAVSEYANVAAGLLATCSKDYSELARDADAIWSERQTLIEAWPK